MFYFVPSGTYRTVEVYIGIGTKRRVHNKLSKANTSNKIDTPKMMENDKKINNFPKSSLRGLNFRYAYTKVPISPVIPLNPTIAIKIFPN